LLALTGSPYTPRTTKTTYSLDLEFLSFPCSTRACCGWFLAVLDVMALASFPNSGRKKIRRAHDRGLGWQAASHPGDWAGRG